MNYSAIKDCDIANGPGVRVSFFVSGCNIRCKGCFNSEAWDFNAGKPFTTKTLNDVIEMLKPDYIKGLTILGGEPYDKHNRYDVMYLMSRVRQVYGDTKSIWVFSGYTFEDHHFRFIPRHNLDAYNFMRLVDVLVDGPFIEDLKNLRLKFRGSENQRIIDVKKSMEAGKIILWDEKVNPMREERLVHLDKIN